MSIIVSVRKVRGRARSLTPGIFELVPAFSGIIIICLPMLITIGILHSGGLLAADVARVGVLLCSEEHFDELLHNICVKFKSE